ncbi:putative chemoreceptor glutamine deamidase CheD [Geobacter sp. OR-1]|uniref:chemotaxis protein CheD n=1 Tax=Geobacter sp. OR-1 TaxID=1266765 RepID=UPI000542D36D|nr:chemotaxis protein CheD [Geobacter sp. OR-1]GAM09809.1 putative chemoreceptor glutamine deamidase CheD [Geobacter sp. OR-1]
MPKPLRHFLLPATIFASREEYLVTTVLGSCVALCLWDKRLMAGGINHFMLPAWTGEGESSAKYGDIAIERLLGMLADLGCRKENLVAKIFGGSSMINENSGAYAIGDRNMELAEQLMRQYGIPVVASETGGCSGRRIIFNTRTGDVYMKKSAKRSK